MPDAGQTASGGTEARFEFEAIGTTWRISTRQPLPTVTATRLLTLIAVFDARWSRFRHDSLVARIAREPAPLRLDSDGTAMLALYDRLAEASEGAINPLVGRALESLGYDAAYSLQPQAGAPVPTPPWTALGWDAGSGSIDPNQPALLDVGAIGKGRLVDLVAEVLAEEVVRSFTVDAGGDLRHRDEDGKVLRVALEHPGDPRRAIGVVRVPASGGSVCASAGNRRRWGEGLHHILDARTGEPVTDIVAAWGIADTAMLADAAATAAFFLDGDSVREALPGVTGVVRIPARGPVEAVGIDGEVFA